MNQASLHQILLSTIEDKPAKAALQHAFELRWASNMTLIKDIFFTLYPEEKHRPHFERLSTMLKKIFKERPHVLQLQDFRRSKEGNWYLSEKMVGMQLYVDRYHKNLKGLQQKLPYLEDLGINLLHLMPLTPRPKGENDGGYAVNSYDKVSKEFGTKADLLNLTSHMRDKDMYLMLDFVVNHTSNEYPWAKKAAKGNLTYQNYYYTYPDRTVPDEFEKTLPEIFPENYPGNFTYNAEMERWVMTVFNGYQWDLNYTNPEVFIAMLMNLAKLVNLGVDVVRFDALAFLWKKIGTTSQNLPEAHMLVSLFRLCIQIVAPGTILLAEAIVAPHEIRKYFGEGNRTGNECEVAYNATLMALLWNSIATKKTSLLQKSLVGVPQKPAEATWINYLRCHDDIGLGFDDRYIYEIGWDAKQHRRFLLNYYCQRLDWSPAKGLLYMYNPSNGDGRITGSAASLLGLEKSLLENDEKGVATALQKVIMLHAIILAYGGIPMIYAGDEIGTLNDYSFLKEKDKKEDSRWVNRPFQNWEVVEALNTQDTPASHLYKAIKNLIAIRKQLPALADRNNCVLHYSPNPHLLIFQRTTGTKEDVWVLCNFDTRPHPIQNAFLEGLGCTPRSGMVDLISKKRFSKKNTLSQLHPYEILWLTSL